MCTCTASLQIPLISHDLVAPIVNYPAMLFTNHFCLQSSNISGVSNIWHLTFRPKQSMQWQSLNVHAHVPQTTPPRCASWATSMGGSHQSTTHVFAETQCTTFVSKHQNLNSFSKTSLHKTQAVQTCRARFFISIYYNTRYY